MSVQNLGSILRRNPQLLQMAEQLRHLATIRKILDEVLPPAVAAHTRAAAVNAGILTVHTDSPAWAAKLRFLTPDLLQAVHSHAQNHDNALLATIKTVRVKSVPPTIPSEKTPVSLTPLSSQTARLLQDVALSIDDPKLRSALQRLANNTKT
ncbi:MAG: DciA family protein [Gammaproteobacteria bacterium]